MNFSVGKNDDVSLNLLVDEKPRVSVKYFNGEKAVVVVNFCEFEKQSVRVNCFVGEKLFEDENMSVMVNLFDCEKPSVSVNSLDDEKPLDLMKLSDNEKQLELLNFTEKVKLPLPVNFIDSENSCVWSNSSVDVKKFDFEKASELRKFAVCVKCEVSKNGGGSTIPIQSPNLRSPIEIVEGFSIISKFIVLISVKYSLLAILWSIWQFSTVTVKLLLFAAAKCAFFPFCSTD